MWWLTELLVNSVIIIGALIVIGAVFIFILDMAMGVYEEYKKEKEEEKK